MRVEVNYKSIRHPVEERDPGCICFWRRTSGLGFACLPLAGTFDVL